jgi:hypothetical protein
MPNDPEWGLLQSQALLDVFKKDCGRPAATMAEVRYWASAQNSKHLEFRVKRRLLELLFGANPDVQQQTGPRFAPPPRGWRVLRRKPKRSLPAIASVIAGASLQLLHILRGADPIVPLIEPILPCARPSDDRAGPHCANASIPFKSPLDC